MQEIVVLKEKYLEISIKIEWIIKQLVILSVNEVQLMVHISGKNVQPLASCLKHDFPWKWDEEMLDWKRNFAPLQQLRYVKMGNGSSRKVSDSVEDVYLN